MMLLPAAKGTCPICAVAHTPGQPHDKQSMYYQTRFKGVHGRSPTWADAIAHCPDDLREKWKKILGDLGAWSEPADGKPIADPVDESSRELVKVGGDPIVVSFNDEEP